MRPGIIALRAANEYRSRDLISYLTLRYYLQASSARLDRWATDVATELIRTRSTKPYRHTRVYKGLNERGAIEYRDLHFPGPNEMLAEASLLRECSSVGGSFSRMSCVFSNVLCKGEARGGMVDPYFKWWKRRQESIGQACKRDEAQVVLYFDLKRFYPSVTEELARGSWIKSAESASLGRPWILLGEKILSDYSSLLKGGGALPMGPMFSHLLANQVLLEFDRALLENFPGSYFRYVDDIALVLPESASKQAKETMLKYLPPGLKLNEEKTLELPAAEWLSITQSFQGGNETRLWMQFITGLKSYLMANPHQTSLIEKAFTDSGFRIQFRDYSRAVKERSFVEKMQALFRKHWFNRKTLPTTIVELISVGLRARAEFYKVFQQLTIEPIPSNVMKRKLQLQRIRYVATRLLYLISPQEINVVEDFISGFAEFSELTAIFRAVRTSDVTALLNFSGTVAQAAAQCIVSAGRAVTCSPGLWTAETQFAWSVLKLNGVDFQQSSGIPPIELPLIQFVMEARSKPASASLDDYYREIFSLTQGAKEQHSELLRYAFDPDEEVFFDAISLLRTSS